MANKVIAATVQFNGISQAANSLASLRKELEKFKAEQAKQDPTSTKYKELAADIASVTNEIKVLEAEQRRVNEAFAGTQQAAGSYNAIAAETKALTEQMKGLAVGVNATQEEFDALKAKIQANNATLAQMTKELKANAGAQSTAVAAAAGSIVDLKDKLKALKDEQQREDPSSDRFKELQQAIAKTSGEIKSIEAEQRKANAAFEATQEAAGSYNALVAETKALTAELKSMSVGVNATQEEFDAVLGRIKQNNAAITDMNREMRNSKSIAERFREGAVAAFKDVALSIVAGVTALEGFNALKGIGELGLDIERGFAQVNTVAQLSEEGLADLQNQVLDTAKTSTANLEEVPGALFKILSATGDVEESQEILAASLRAAKVGFTDVGSAADAGVGIYGAVKDQVADVNEVFDVLFRTQKEGVLTFQDLAKNIPAVTPAANTLGISFKETAAALATLTKAGVSADIATTQLKAGLSELSQGAKQKGLKDIGVNVFDSAGKINSLNDIVKQLGASLDGLTDEQRSAKLQQIGFGQEAVGSILTLTRNIETLGQVTDSVVNNSLGEFDRQFAASGNTIDDLKAATNELQTTLIQELQPAFIAVGRSLIGIVTGFAKLIGILLQNKGIVLLLAAAYALLNAAKIQTIAITARERIVQAAKFVLDKAELALTSLRTAATTAYGVAQSLLTGRLTLAAAAQQLLNLAMAANPVGLLVAGVLALAGALLLYSNRSKEVTAAEKERARISSEINDAVKATNEEIGKETAQLELLVRGINDENKSKEEKKAITDQLISQYGTYLSELDKEAVKAGEVEAAYIKIKNAITENIVARQKSEAVEKIFTEQIAKQRDAAFSLGQQFGKTAQEVLDMVDTFTQFPETIQEAIAQGKGLQLLGSDATKGFSDAQKSAIQFFVEVEKNSLRAGDAVDGYLTKSVDIAGKLREGADINKLGADVALLRIVAASKAIDQGIAEIDAKFGTLGSSGGGTFTKLSEGANATAATVAQLKEELSALQKQQEETSTTSAEWQELQKEIDRVQKQIEAITGATKAHQAEAKKTADQLKKEAEEAKAAAEKRANDLFELRRQLSDLTVATEDDATAKLIAAETERYTRSQQLALDNAAKVILDKDATNEQIIEATQLQNAILQKLDIDHYQRLNEIAGDALKEEIAQQEKADATAISNRQRLLGLKLDTVEQEIENEEKNFKRRRELIVLEGRLRLAQLDLETQVALKAAASDKERTAILENEAAKRVGIIKETSSKIEEERKKQGPLLARILGISPDELQKFQEVFKGFTSVLNEAIDQFFAARLEALDKLIANSQERIDIVAQAAQDQVEKVAALEERLATATGDRRVRLLALIEAERRREAELFAEKVRQEKVKAEIEAQKVALENKQSKIRKAQAIAQAIANTAVGITRTIAEVPKVDFGISTAVLIGLYAALGAAQVALISAQKFAKGGKVDGPSHDRGGVKMAVPSQNRIVELEGDEYVTNKRATALNESILDRINAEGHRKKFALVDHSKLAAGGKITQANFGAINGAVKDQGSQQIAALGQTNALLGQLVDKPIFLSVVEYERVRSKVVATQSMART